MAEEENKRQWKDKLDIKRELDIEEMKAQTARMRAEQQQREYEAAMAQAGFLQPGDNMQLASMTQGFGANTGTQAGGLAYQQGVDFGSPVYLPDDSPNVYEQQLFKPKGGPVQEDIWTDNIEYFGQQDMDDFMAKKGELIDLSAKASAMGVDLNKYYYDDPVRQAVVDDYKRRLREFESDYQQRVEGYLSTEKAADKGYSIGEALTGGRYHTFADLGERKRFDSTISNMNQYVDEYNTTQLTNERKQFLFGRYDNPYDAYVNGEGAVGNMKKQVEQMIANGDHENARILEERIKTEVFGPGYDATADRDRAVDWAKQQMARDKFSAGQRKSMAIGTQFYEGYRALKNNKDTSSIQQALGASNAWVDANNVFHATIPPDKATALEGVDGFVQTEGGGEVTIDLNNESSDQAYKMVMDAATKTKSNESAYGWEEARRKDLESYKGGGQVATYTLSPITSAANKLQTGGDATADLDKLKTDLDDIAQNSSRLRSVERDGSVFTFRNRDGSVDAQFDMSTDGRDSSNGSIQMEKYVEDIIQQDEGNILKNSSKGNKFTGTSTRTKYYYGQEGTIGAYGRDTSSGSYQDEIHTNNGDNPKTPQQTTDGGYADVDDEFAQE